MSLLGLDVGTTGCKAVAFDTGGRPLASAYREYPLVQPREEWIELEPEVIWESVKAVIAEVNAAIAGGASSLKDPVTALAVSAQGETVTAVDSSGHTLYNFIVTFDNRTRGYIVFWEERLGRRELYELTGMPLHPMYSVNKIMWMKRELPQVRTAVKKFLLVEDFVIYRLTGEFGIDYTLASRTMGFDVRAKRWAERVLDIAGIYPGELSPVYPSGTPVGTVRRALQDELGFSGAVTVVTGGHDQPSGALGAGIFESGIAMNATGTVDAICPVFSGLQPPPGMEKANFAFYPYVIDTLYCTIGFNLTGGLLLRWYRDLFCAEERRLAEESGRDLYDIIFEEMAERPKDLYVLPHFVGSGTPHLDPYSKGAIVGLKLSTAKSDLIRSIVDGINFEMKYNIELMRENGIALEELRSIGGGAKSAAWLRLKASCFGMAVKKPRVSEAVSLGAAILAGCGTGVFSSLEEGARTMVEISEEYYPDDRLSAVYEEKYAKYRGLYGCLAEFNRTLE